VSTTVIDLVVVFALFVFMLVLVCFCVSTFFSANKDLYKGGNVTAVGWQITLCDPLWYVSSRSGVTD